eukprot:COSAG01_NODE_4705_length_4801_cov_10.775840_3_plen_90_part_00
MKTKHRAGGTGQHYSPAGCAGPRGGPEHPEGAGAPDPSSCTSQGPVYRLPSPLSQGAREAIGRRRMGDLSDCVSGANFYLKPVNSALGC